jgi:glycosyltransferase involved in cell wall biosynthesis
MNHASRLHLWAPGLFGFKGGIQVYSQFLLNALKTVYPDVLYDVFLMHDRPTQNTGSIERSQKDASPCRFHYTGHIPQPFRTPAFAAQLLGSALWHRPRLIITTHLNFTKVAHRVKQLTGIPYWAIAHGFEAWDVQDPETQRALQNADRILAVSTYTRERLLQHLPLDPNRIQLLPNTFDASRFRVASKPAHLLQRFGLRADQPILLTVNRLAAGEPFHSYDQILAALPTIQTSLPDVHYVIVGKGDDRPRLEQLIAKHQMQHCVTLAGFVPDEDLPDFYNLCDVFAMPSKLEGFGIVYLEALASGKPVLGGLDGAIDALQNGRLGALVAPDDQAAIAQTLTELLQKTYPNPLLYNPDALRQAAIETFGFEAFCHTLALRLESTIPSFYESSPCDSLGRASAGWPQSSGFADGASSAPTGR